LALWNALPRVEKRKKLGDRRALIDHLWSAIEALPDPEPQVHAKRPSKQDAVIAMLRRPEASSVDPSLGAIARCSRTGSSNPNGVDALRYCRARFG